MIKEINLRLGKKAIKRIDNISEEMEFTIRSQSVSYAANVTDQILNIKKKGGKINVTYPNGECEDLLII